MSQPAQPRQASEPAPPAGASGGVTSPGAPGSTRAVAPRAAVSEPGFVTRLGLALAAPRWALAIAGDRRNPGRSGSDLLRVIGLLLLGGHLRGLFVAGWLAVGVHAGLGLRTGAAALSAALTTPLAFLVLAALALWLAAGPARQLGRAFDLACVAAVPLLLVLLVGAGLTQVLELDQRSPQLMRALSLGVLGLGFGWAGAVVALGMVTARARVSIAAVAPAAVAAKGRRVGQVALGVAAALAALQLGWITRHLGELRPVVANERAPAFALREIGPGGVLGAPYQVTPGAAPERALPGGEGQAAGRLTVVDFWATWCGICLRGLPALEAFRQAHPEIDVVSVNLDDATLARQLFDEKGYQLRLLLDDGQVSRRYNVSALPHLVVIDRAGMVHRVVRGHPGALEALLPPHAHDEH